MEPTKIVLEAIALRKCIIARYNQSRFKLAPHILYTRHGERFIDAVAVERDGRPPREAKVGTFKLSGLQQLELIERKFVPHQSFDAAGAKYDGVSVFAVEPI